MPLTRVQSGVVDTGQVAVLATNQVFTAFHGVTALLLPVVADNARTIPLTANWDLNQRQVATLFLSAANCWLAQPTNQTAGGTYVLFVKTLSGNATLSMHPTYRFSQSISTPTVTTGPSAVDIFTFISDGRFMYGSYVQNYSYAGTTFPPV